MQGRIVVSWDAQGRVRIKMSGDIHPGQMTQLYGLLGVEYRKYLREQRIRRQEENDRRVERAEPGTSESGT